MKPWEAYYQARREGPSDYTRNIVLSSPKYSYEYARDIDGFPREDTKNAVLCRIDYSYEYARRVEKVIFDRSNICADFLYINDFYHIGMPYMMQYKCDIDFMPLNSVCLDVL